MATKGRIQVVGFTVLKGECVVRAADPATVQILADALGRTEGLKIEKAWPRRKGGRDYPKLKLATAGRRAK